MAVPIITDPPPEGGDPIITSEERYPGKYFQVNLSGAKKDHVFLGSQKLAILMQ